MYDTTGNILLSLTAMYHIQLPIYYLTHSEIKNIFMKIVIINKERNNFYMLASK